VQRIAALPAAEQIEEVRRELVRRNTGFDGQMDHKIENGVVTELRIDVDRVTDISPLRVFDGLRVLTCAGKPFQSEKSPLAILSLKGMNLAALTQLDLSSTNVGDAQFAYFKDCKDLKSVNLRGTQATDAGLAHFQDCQALEAINLGWTRVGDAGLAYLKDCKNLKILYLNWVANVTDTGLTQFKHCNQLAVLAIDHTKVADLSSLEGLPLKELSYNLRSKHDAGILRSCKSLERISGLPVAEFWERYDKGE